MGRIKLLEEAVLKPGTGMYVSYVNEQVSRLTNIGKQSWSQEFPKYKMMTSRSPNKDYMEQTYGNNPKAKAEIVKRFQEAIDAYINEHNKVIARNISFVEDFLTDIKDSGKHELSSTFEVSESRKAGLINFLFNLGAEDLSQFSTTFKEITGKYLFDKLNHIPYQGKTLDLVLIEKLKAKTGE